MSRASSHTRRLRAERRFRLYGKLALGVAIGMLALLLVSIGVRGAPGFMQAQIRLPVTFDAMALGIAPGEEIDGRTPSGYQHLAQTALDARFPDAAAPRDRHALHALLSGNAGLALKQMLEKNHSLLRQSAEAWLPASSEVDQFLKHTDASRRKLSDRQLAWLSALQTNGAVRLGFNASFFSRGDSRNPETAGFLSAIIGSGLTLVVCLLAAFPLGVMTAVYLEEFARKSRFVDLVEVNINNLAAVPSIVFGLLGLSVYINLLGMPRSSPLVGGLTLALMIMPVIIITTRVALASVPPSIRDAARGLGATPVQVVRHHVLPLAMPGIMTGTILGLSRAIGETAPLLMIGMVAFVADLPSGFASSATVMPVQIFLWASSPEAGFAEKTAAGILVLLVLLLAMNMLAIVLRKRFEVRW